MRYFKIITTSIFATLAFCIGTHLFAVEGEKTKAKYDHTPIQIQQTDTAESEALIWLEDKEEVFKMANEQQKLIFLLSGRYGCGICQRTKINLDSVLGLRQIVDKNYIMWFSDYDTEAGKEETQIYTQHLIDEGAKTLPLVAVINPEDPENYVSSFWGSKTVSFLKTFLTNAINIVPNESISANRSKVTIHNNILYVSGSSENEIINIYTITGQNLYTIQKNAPNISINASSFPNGILIIHSTKGWSSKIIKR